MRRETEFLTIQEALELMPKGVQVDRHTLYRERKKGVLPAYKFGGRIYFKRSDLEKYINNALETA
jgi:excisionase family DNA binding protein